MKKLLRPAWGISRRGVTWLAIVAALTITYGYNLAGITHHRLSASEHQALSQPLGWHGIYHNPLELPYKLSESIGLKTFGHHVAVVRAPSVIWGVVTTIAFGWLLYVWHGRRTAILGGLLFAVCGFVLHATRLATLDIYYLSVPVLLLTGFALLKDWGDKPWLTAAVLLIWACLCYFPGVIWLVIAAAIWQRTTLQECWAVLTLRTKLILVSLLLVSQSLVVVAAIAQPRILLTWAGWPQQLLTAHAVWSGFQSLGLQLLVHGPMRPDLWLTNLPLLDGLVFTLLFIGLYFYGKRLRARRSGLLLSLLILSVLLVGFNSVLPLSALVPLLYIFAAAGLAYLLYIWLRVFPYNPIARSLGIGLITIAILLSASYNVRAYFIAWPAQAVTVKTFTYKP